MMSQSVDEQCLVEVAASQQGYFTRPQAEDCGYSTSFLTYHTQRSNFVRAHRGVYRLRDFPSMPFESVMAAWLAIGAAKAVVSHEFALRLHDLSDVIPNAIHLTVPRTSHHYPKLAGVRIHTTSRVAEPSDAVWREGLRVTSVARTIVDCANTGTGPEQIEMAVRQAIDRGLTPPARLRESGARCSQRVQRLIKRSLEVTKS